MNSGVNLAMGTRNSVQSNFTKVTNIFTVIMFRVIFLGLLDLTDSFLLQRAPFCPICNRGAFGPMSTATSLLASVSTQPSDESSFQRIFVLCDGDNGFCDNAHEIARSLGLPIFSTAEFTNLTQSANYCDYSHVLRLLPYEYGTDLVTFALAIEPVESNLERTEQRRRRRSKRKPKAFKPSATGAAAFFVDLCPPKTSRSGKRAAGASGTSDLLVKAVGPRKGLPNDRQDGAIVWDLTAGLGQDSLILAMNGAAHVHMVERNLIVAALLRDAMRRLDLIATSPESTDRQQDAIDLLKRLSLTIGEGKDELENGRTGQECDVVYLDPMFPPRQKQSAVKKGMSILHGLLETHIESESDIETGKQQEEQELLLAAIDVARMRVVVKRPIKASALGDGSKKPSYAITGSTNRWDVYVAPCQVT